MEKNGGALPTGCYKCGRPGHWSRDCPSSGTNTNPNFNPSSNPSPNPNQNRNSSGASFNRAAAPKPVEKTTEKPKKLPRTRPKLTPELLVSNDGLGYVLRHFPRSFKYRGRGHEAKDLGNLIGLYTQWHSHVLPYYSFDQFVQKVEKVGTTRRVRTCIRELKERVANGGDPLKLHEPPIEHDGSNREPAAEGDTNLEAPSADMGELQFKSHDAADMQEEMFDEIYRTATEELQSQNVATEVIPDQSSVKESPNQVSNKGTTASREIQITEDQKARMEANRLKALERAAARARSSQAA